MNVIEIRDPQLNEVAILAQIAEQVQGKNVPNFAEIGPVSLRTTGADSLTKQVQSSSYEALADLMIMHQLREHEFKSNAPVVGPLIVAVRNFWNWVSAKWSVRTVIQQQTAVNGQIALLLLEMESQLTKQDKVLAALQAKIAQLESALAESHPNKK